MSKITRFPERASTADEQAGDRLAAPAEPYAVTYERAAELLSLESTRSIGRYVKRGWLRVVGYGSGRKVVTASIMEFLNRDTAA